MRSTFIFIVIFALSGLAASWRYETRCTRVISEPKPDVTPSTLDEIELESTDIETDYPTSTSSNHLTLRCANTNDFLFIGLTQYGVFGANVTETCSSAVLLSKSSPQDCLVTVDYLANECNGLNSCRVQLDAQFLHSCKRHSDYLSLAYECIPGAQRVEVCSNDETFLIDSTLNRGSGSGTSSLSRFGAFYLTSPGYPNEYADNLRNCSCKLEYVKIESSPSVLASSTATRNEISLSLSAYEFDLEEAGSVDESNSNKCNKDFFSIASEEKNETLCGHYKEFKEFYAHGSSVSLNFQSDDFITRRGFLFKISTMAASKCPPPAHRRFDSTRCISLHHDKPASWSEASRSCVSRGGRLLTLNDFVDSMRMSSVVRADESGVDQYWVALARKTSSSPRRSFKCSSKSANGWHDEKSCSVKRPYICEYDAVKQAPITSESLARGMSDTNGNRLIRVSCGHPSVPPTSTPKSIPSNSILNTQRPQGEAENPPLSSSPIPTIVLDKEYDDYEPEIEATSTTKTTAESSTQSKIEQPKFNPDYLVIVALVCGIAIVLVAVNVFCIWNYYNRKLNSHARHQYHQTSTLLSSARSKNPRGKNTSSISTNSSTSTGVGGVTNRTLTSCLGGGSYIRVPVYDLNSRQEPRESTDSGISSSSFKPHECIRVLLGDQNQQDANILSHYYETLGKKQPPGNMNEYHVYNPIEPEKFDSMVVMPTMVGGNASTMVLLTSAGTPIGFSTLVPSSTSLKPTQYSSMIYGDLGTSYGGSSTASSSSGGSSKPLLSFVAVNNASSVSADTEATDSPPNV